MSGGSRMAYLLSESEPNIAGIPACGSGSGIGPDENTSNYIRAKLRPGMVICGLFGTNDYYRREGVRTHKEFKMDSRLIWFLRNHDWAHSEVILEDMTHVFGEILGRNKDPEWDALRTEFAVKYLGDGNTDVDNMPDEARARAAEKTSNALQRMGQAEILKRLGDAAS